MRKLDLLCIQKASKDRPPNRGFYSCRPLRRRSPRGRRATDSSAVVHTERDQRQTSKSRIPLLLGIQKAPKERPPNRRFYCCWAPRESGIQRAAADLRRQKQK